MRKVPAYDVARVFVSAELSAVALLPELVLSQYHGLGHEILVVPDAVGGRQDVLPVDEGPAATVDGLALDVVLEGSGEGKLVDEGVVATCVSHLPY